MSRAALAGLLMAAVLAAPARAAGQRPEGPRPEGPRPEEAFAACLFAAADVHRVPAAVLAIILQVESGSLGRVSRNSNGTVDIGPMQINEMWLPQLARHWHTGLASAYLALRDSFCANIEAAAWILRQALDEANGDFWTGVGFYHSHDPGYRTDYLRKVLERALRLQARAAPLGRN